MFSCTAGGVIFPHGPFMIGAGVCKTPARTLEWLKVAAVESGSYTPESRPGNTGKVFWPETLEEFLECGVGLNSYNMPNMGYVEAAKQLALYAGEQPLLVNIAGFSVADYLLGIEIFSALKSVSAIVLNLGCPNSGHGEIMSFSIDDVASLLKAIASSPPPKPIWLKFSPYTNPAELRRMAELVNFYPNLVRAVVTCNTIPNCYAGPGTIDPNNGLAGMSGPAILPFARGQTRQFRQHLDIKIDVVGVGGITTGNDIIDRLADGAKLTQLVSLAHWAGDPDTFHEHLLNPATSGRFTEYLNHWKGHTDGQA